MFAAFLKKPWLPLAGILLVTIAVYAPFLSNAFVLYDDQSLLVARSFRRIFFAYDPELYAPLTLLSFQLEYLFVGRFAPAVTHGIGLLIHLGNVALVWSIVRSLTRKQTVGLLAAALFALHPLNVEAVLWASARKDLLSAFFALASLMTYIRYARSASPRAYYGSVAFFLLALLSKVSVAPLPLVFLLIDWLENRHKDPCALREKLPHAILAVVFIVVALFGKTVALKDHSVATLFFVFPKTVAFTLLKIFVPTNLSVMYPQSTVTLASPDILLSLLALFALFAFFALALKTHKKLPTFGLAFFLLLFLPNIAALQKHGFLFFSSDRFAYLPGIGIALLVALAAEAVSRRSALRLAVLAASLIVLASLAVVSRKQAAVWRSTQSLMTRALALYPDAVMAHNSLGVAFAMEGNRDAALEEFVTAIPLAPWYYPPYFNIADVLRKNGYEKEAFDVYRTAINALGEHGGRSAEDVKLFNGLAEFLDQNNHKEDAATIRRLLIK